jgi:hypothetical protein
MGISRYESAGLTATGPCGCGRPLCTRGGRINAEALFHGDGVRRGEAWHSGHSTAGHRAYSGSARAVREAYMNPLISPSRPSLFAIQLYSQQPAENFSTTPNYFHPLQMASLAFKPYTYKPTPPRSKSAATRHKPAPEQVSLLNKLQQIRSCSASLSTPRPAAAAAADGDGGYRPRIRGM